MKYRRGFDCGNCNVYLEDGTHLNTQRIYEITLYASCDKPMEALVNTIVCNDDKGKELVVDVSGPEVVKKKYDRYTVKSINMSRGKQEIILYRQRWWE